MSLSGRLLYFLTWLYIPYLMQPGSTERESSKEWFLNP